MNQVKATFDTTTQEGQIRVFNAQAGASTSLKNLENGEIIEAVAVMQYPQVINSYGQDQEATITVIFAEDGTAYAGVSDTVAEAGEKLISLVNATGMEKFRVAITKQKSGKGNEFLSIRLVP